MMQDILEVGPQISASPNLPQLIKEGFLCMILLGFFLVFFSSFLLLPPENFSADPLDYLEKLKIFQRLTSCPHTSTTMHNAVYVHLLIMKWLHASML